MTDKERIAMLESKVKGIESRLLELVDVLRTMTSDITYDDTTKRNWSENGGFDWEAKLKERSNTFGRGMVNDE
jgi:hypothetical protein